LVPTAAYHLTRRWSIVVRILLETTSFIALLAGFGFWLFGLSVIHTWIIYAILLVLLLEIGGHLIDQYKRDSLSRVRRSTLADALTVALENFNKMFQSESSLYLSVPLGFALGMIVSLVWDLPQQSTIFLFLFFTLSLAPIVLMYFLIVGFLRMTNSMFRVGNVDIAQVEQTTKHGFGRLFGQALELVVPTQKPAAEETRKRELDIACEVSNLRKLYLYDATHNVLLLVTLTIFVLNFLGIIVGWALLVLSLLGATFLFSQLPYIIGQSLLHRQVLMRYTGVEHAEAAEKLGKYAPRCPTPTFIAALCTTGTAGGVLSGLLNEFAKGLFK
jgi:hypothetical protein